MNNEITNTQNPPVTPVTGDRYEDDERDALFDDRTLPR
jgi:hypothetical protein